MRRARYLFAPLALAILATLVLAAWIAFGLQVILRSDRMELIRSLRRNVFRRESAG